MDNGINTYDMHTAPATWSTVDAGIWEAARLTAQTAFKAYCRNLYVKLYLYHRRSNQGAPGQTCIARDLPGAGWELSEAAHIPRHITEDALTSWFHAKISRLPILIP